MWHLGRKGVFPLLTVMLGCPTNPAPKFVFEVIVPLPKHLSSILSSARQLLEKGCLILFFFQGSLSSGIWRREEKQKACRPTSLPSCLMPPNQTRTVRSPQAKVSFHFQTVPLIFGWAWCLFVPHTRVPSTIKLTGSFYLSHLKLIWSAQTDTCGQTSASLCSMERNWSLTHHTAEHGSEGHGFPLFLAKTGCGRWLRCANSDLWVVCS